eukprot:Tbor_TRINITY_DN5648_c1_g10::TRINITY_DN5648_c1_g10_i1::g.8700::m.8700
MNYNTESDTGVSEGQENSLAPEINVQSATSGEQMPIDVSKPNTTSTRLIKRVENGKERRQFAEASSNEGADCLTDIPFVSRTQGPLLIANTVMPISPSDSKTNDYNNEQINVLRPLISPYESYSETDENRGAGHEITETYQFVDEYPPMRTAFFAVLPVFMAYSSLVTLQGNLRHRLGIDNSKSARSYEFSSAASLLFLGNLCLRLLHNVFLGFLRPRQRVYVSYVALTISSGIIAIFYFMLDFQSIVFMYIAYLIAGTGIGTFESNIMSVITPLGHETKVWAQYGIPAGFSAVSVGTFTLLVFLPHNTALLIIVFSGIAISNIMGLIFFKFCVPDIHFAASEQNLRDLYDDLKQFKKWLPKIGLYSFTFALNMFCLSIGSSLQQFIYDSDALPLVHGSDVTIPKNVHRILVNIMALFGDITGRKIAYCITRKVHPLWYLLIVIIGAVVLLSKQAIIAPIGMFLVMLSNGLIYSSTTKHIDIDVDPKYNLVALSVWFFIGDVGSFIGANVVNPLLVVVGSV